MACLMPHGVKWWEKGNVRTSTSTGKTTSTGATTGLDTSTTTRETQSRTWNQWRTTASKKGREQAGMRRNAKCSVGHAVFLFDATLPRALDFQGDVRPFPFISPACSSGPWDGGWHG